MSAPVVAAMIGFCSALIVGLIAGAYANGGRSALQRRTIKQELELFTNLSNVRDDRLLRRSLSLIVEQRLWWYLSRQLPFPKEVTRRRDRRFWFLWSVLVLLVTIAWVVMVKFPELADITAIVLGVGGFSIGVLMSVHIRGDLRGQRAERQQRRSDAARRQLEQLELERSRRGDAPSLASQRRLNKRPGSGSAYHPARPARSTRQARERMLRRK